MDIKPIEPVNKIRNYDIDKDQVYDTKTGKTIEDVEFSEILRKEMEG